ncbi:hypothetical protein GALL_478350 [mine drainage metagenome]|uniref:DUF1501 domain-containing protein n=1 Tax=mine drainage metagenome TaxID=410659 RepID=A0A1J5PG03_9ZZZZ
MDTVSRRRFLQLVGAGAAGAAASQLSFAEIARAAISNPLPLNTPILVIVTLYGGNDGLNSVIPYNDPAYYANRPDISYGVSDVITLDSQLALNRSMTGMKTLWDQKKLAIVRGVGYPNPDHSHFKSMAIWQSASPVSAQSTGWIGRWLDGRKPDPMSAISLGSVIPPLLTGSKRVGSALPLGGLVVPSGALGTDCQMLAKPSFEDGPLQALAASSMSDLFRLSTEISSELKKPAPTPTDLPTIQGGNAGGNSSLGQQLDVVAKLIGAGAPTRVWSVSLGGFDTHADEKGAQSILIGSVSDSIARFLSQIRSTNRSKDVVVMAYSEFGRRVKGNSSQGTDHGTSGPVFVMGEKVAGGFYGDQPSLTQLNAGDLSVTTDFRDVYASLLEGVLATPADSVLGKWSGRTPLLKS